MNRNVIVHINNWAILGGIESLVMDFANTFPEYHHIFITINSSCEDLTFCRYIQNCGIRYMNAGGPITENLIDEIDPAIIFLHNTKGEHLGGEWPYEWLQKWKIVAVHHARTWPLIPARRDWFVSDYVRQWYKSIEPRMKAFTMPPCVFEKPYTAIERPGRVPVIGRIQSGTNLKKGKVPDAFFDLADTVRDCNFLIVTSNGIAKKHRDKTRFRFEPIRPGMTAEYLKEIDIFAIWGNTTETWSRVATEANLSGIPIVARNHNDGLAEQIMKSGGGVLVHSKKGFVENLQALVNNPKRAREIGEKGRKWCLENASSPVLRDRFIDTFLEWGIN